MTGIDLVELLFKDEPCLINVLDVGASDEDFMTAPYKDLVVSGHARVVGFEPDAENCAILNRNYGEPHLFLPYFLGDGGPATFYETSWSLTGSLYKPNRPLLEKFQNLHECTTLVAEHAVQTRRLDDLPEVGDIDFIKIDTQGAELSIFQGGERVLRNAMLVNTEVEFVELYENQPLFADVDRVLRSYGYQFHTFHGKPGSRCFKPLMVDNDATRGLRQWLWSDAIYVRDWMHMETLPTHKLKKLAVLLHKMHLSYDLCHFILSEIDARGNTSYANQYRAGVCS